MKTVTAAEAEAHFEELLEQVINGEEIIVTLDEKAVARLVPDSTQVKGGKTEE